MKHVKMLVSATVLTVAATILAPSVSASAASATIPPKGGATVSATAAPWTPQLATSGTDGSVEQIRQVVQCGAIMYAVGRFSSIKRYSVTSARNNAFSFTAATGYVGAWNPNVNGQVNSVAFNADCTTAYLGGTFTSVNGTAVKNLAAVSTSTGAVIATFAHNAAGKVDTIVRSGTHLLVGGAFTGIDSSTKKYFVSLNLTTGRDDGYLNLNISGTYVYTDDGGKHSAVNATQVYNTQLSPDGTKLLAEGVFTSVGGQARRQIVMLDLGTSTATVDPWYSASFDAYCNANEPFYLQAASWAPDMSAVYVASTGGKPANGLGYISGSPRGGLCDAAAAFSSGASSTQTPLWINYTGCDSLYSTAADNNAVYVGGHNRWLQSPVQCDGNGNGSTVTSAGMGAIDPTSGNVITGADPSVGKYTRARGLGADDLLLTSAGLWIASDNAQNSSSCGLLADGKPAYAKAGLCFLPYPSA